jgi:hypothetical protein
MTRPTIVDDLQVVVRGDLPVEIVNYARDRIAELGDDIAEPVLHTRIRLTHQPGPGIDRPFTAQGNVTLKGRLVRAQVAGRSAQEAVDLVRDGLRGRLVRHAPHWEARRGGKPAAEPGEWRHNSEPSQRPSYFPRSVEDREVLRHKSFTPRRVRPDEAAWEMDQLDYSFHLFTDAETDRDAVIYRDSPTGFRMQRTGAGPDPTQDGPWVVLDEQVAPRLSFAEARERLEVSEAPFVFFVDRETDRGAVLYHRYDGHYGLITPAAT